MKSLSFRSFKKSTIIALTLIFIFSQNSFANLPELSVVTFSDQIHGVDTLICLVLIWYETIDYACNLKVLEIVIG